MRNPFEDSETFIIRSMLGNNKEMMAHRDKVNSGNIISEYILIQQKKSDLSRSKRDEIVWKFEYYKSKGLYSEEDLQKIKQLIASK